MNLWLFLSTVIIASIAIFFNRSALMSSNATSSTSLSPSAALSVQQQQLPDPSAIHRVVSWNVLAHEYTRYNTESGQKETESQKLARRSKIDAMLHLMEPDVACLQEVTVDFLNALKLKQRYDLVYEVSFLCLRETRTYRLLTCSTCDQLRTGSVDGCAIAVNATRYERVAFSPHHFVTAPHSRLSLAALYRVRSSAARPATSPSAAAAVAAASAEQYLLVINVHLEGHPSEHNVRVAQAHEAIEHGLGLLRALPGTTASAANVGVVLCGDHNEEDISAIQTLLTSAPYKLQALIPSAPTSYFRQSDSQKIIDYLFISRSLTPTITGGVVVWPEMGRGRLRRVPYLDDAWPSDHFALVTDLRFVTPSSAASSSSHTSTSSSLRSKL